MLYTSLAVYTIKKHINHVFIFCFVFVLEKICDDTDSILNPQNQVICQFISLQLIMKKQTVKLYPASLSSMEHTAAALGSNQGKKYI